MRKLSNLLATIPFVVLLLGACELPFEVVDQDQQSTAPEIPDSVKLRSIENGAVYFGTLTVDWDAEEGVQVQTFLRRLADGQGEFAEVPEGYVIENLGEEDVAYDLKVRVLEDGSVFETIVSFVLHGLPPQPEIFGLEQNAVYTEPVSFHWNTLDIEPFEEAGFLKKNGGAELPYVAGTPIVDNGTYQALVYFSYTNEHGYLHLKGAMRYFTVAIPGGISSPVISGVPNGLFDLLPPRTPTWTTPEGLQSEVEVTLEGEPISYVEGQALTAAGNYEVRVTFSDGTSSNSSLIEFGLKPPTPVLVFESEKFAGGTGTNANPKHFFRDTTLTWNNFVEGSSQEALLWNWDNPTEEVPIDQGHRISENGRYTLKLIYTQNGKTNWSQTVFVVEQLPEVEVHVEHPSADTFVVQWNEVPDYADFFATYLAAGPNGFFEYKLIEPNPENRLELFFENEAIDYFSVDFTYSSPNHWNAWTSAFREYFYEVE